MPPPLYILVPPPHASVVIHGLDILRSTVADVCARIEQRCSWATTGFSLRLQGGGDDLTPGMRLSSLGLSTKCPTLLLVLVRSGNVLRAFLQEGIGAAVLAAELAAATRIQAAARTGAARRERRWRRRARQLRAVCARSELRAAALLQSTWRRHRDQHRCTPSHGTASAAAVTAAPAPTLVMSSMATPMASMRPVGMPMQPAGQSVPDEAAAACVIQQTARRRWARRLHARARQLEALLDHDLTDATMLAQPALRDTTLAECLKGADSAEVAPRPALPNDLIGAIYKRTRLRTVGRYRLATWRHRYVFADGHALCYRHMRGSAGRPKPHGVTKSIPFASIQRVGVQGDDPLVLVLRCSQSSGGAPREVFFRFPTYTDCSEWAQALCAVAAQARLDDQDGTGR